MTPRFPRLASIALLVAAVALPAAAQDFQVSKKAKNFNFGVRTAADPETGAILVVWTEIKPSDSTKASVWAALLRKLPNGNYRRKNDVRLSPKKGYHNNPDVVWSAAAKTFVVVWDTRRVPGQDSDVFARFVNPKKGKAAGAVVTVADSADAEFSPKLSVRPDGSMDVIYAHETGIGRGDTNLTHLGFDREFEPMDKATVLGSVRSNLPKVEFASAVAGGEGGVLECGVAVVTVFENGRQFVDIYLVRDGVGVRAQTYTDATVVNVALKETPTTTEVHVTRQQTGSLNLQTEILATDDWSEFRKKPLEEWDFGAAQNVRLATLYSSDPFGRTREDVVHHVITSDPTDIAVQAYAGDGTPNGALFKTIQHLDDVVATGGLQMPKPAGELRSSADDTDTVIWWLKKLNDSKQQVWVHLASLDE